MAYAMGGEKSRITSAPPGEAFDAGVFVARNSSGLLMKANANNADSYPAEGLSERAATAAMVTSGELIAVVGVCDFCDGATSLTPGATCWLGESDGTLTTTRPTGHTDIAQAVGHALSATEFSMDVSPTYEQIGITS